MAATHGEYRGYLRSSRDVEVVEEPRYHPEPTYRSLLFGILAVMGLLQLASSVAIFLHLTGYLQEIDLSTTPHQPIEEVHTEPMVNALRGERRGKRGKAKEGMTSAHLPVRTYQDPFKKSETSVITIDWDDSRASLNNMAYQNGKLLVVEPGFYYVYAKTCFRYYKLPRLEDDSLSRLPAVDVSNIQLIQYIYHVSVKMNNKATILAKSGSTMRWNDTSYNMYCAQQSRGVQLDRGDSLYVNVSNAWMLDPEGEGSYFGAIKLGN
ncbi:tumor necrosis factor ligand superfamily member 11 [Pholidichthys leucotaenia]